MAAKNMIFYDEYSPFGSGDSSPNNMITIPNKEKQRKNILLKRKIDKLRSHLWSFASPKNAEMREKVEKVVQEMTEDLWKIRDWDSIVDKAESKLSVLNMKGAYDETPLTSENPSPMSSAQNSPSMKGMRSNSLLSTKRSSFTKSTPILPGKIPSGYDEYTLLALAEQQKMEERARKDFEHERTIKLKTQYELEKQISEREALRKKRSEEKRKSLLRMKQAIQQWEEEKRKEKEKEIKRQKDTFNMFSSAIIEKRDLQNMSQREKLNEEQRYLNIMNERDRKLIEKERRERERNRYMMEEFRHQNEEMQNKKKGEREKNIEEEKRMLKEWKNILDKQENERMKRLEDIKSRQSSIETISAPSKQAERERKLREEIKFLKLAQQREKELEEEEIRRKEVQKKIHLQAVETWNQQLSEKMYSKKAENQKMQIEAEILKRDIETQKMKEKKEMKNQLMAREEYGKELLEQMRLDSELKKKSNFMSDRERGFHKSLLTSMFSSQSPNTKSSPNLRLDIPFGGYDTSSPLSSASPLSSPSHPHSPFGSAARSMIK